MKKSDVNFYIEITNNIMKYAEVNDYELVPTLKAISEYLVLMASIFEGIDAVDEFDEFDEFDEEGNYAKTSTSDL